MAEQQVWVLTRETGHYTAYEATVLGVFSSDEKAMYHAEADAWETEPDSVNWHLPEKWSRFSYEHRDGWRLELPSGDKYWKGAIYTIVPFTVYQ